LVAAASAVIAASVLMPRMHANIQPRGLYGGYVTKPAEATKRAVLDTRIVDYESNKEQLDAKLGRLELAVGLLVTAIILVVLALGVATMIERLG
jgi:hypothetical protein